MSGAKLRCFSKCLFTCFSLSVPETVTGSLLIGNKLNWLKFPDTKLGFLAHNRKKLSSRQKDMGC